MTSLKLAFWFGGLSLMEFYQRNETRKRTPLRHGQILGGQYLWLAECKFHDLSQSGARVKLGCNIPLPKQIYLLDLLYLTVRNAEIAWRQGLQLGLRLTSPAVPCYLPLALGPIASEPVTNPMIYSPRETSQVSDDTHEVI